MDLRASPLVGRVVLQVNTNDIGGGAARCAWSLFEAYHQRGLSSWLAVGRKVSHNSRVLVIPGAQTSPPYARLLWALYGRSRKLEGRIWGLVWIRDVLRTIASGDSLRERWLGRENFNFPHSHRVLDLPPQRPDILHCHNLHGGFFDLHALSALSQQVPLILTLHDAWLLSGHCAHSLDCQKWRTGCGQCPDLSLYPDLYRDGTAQNWQRKRRIYESSRLYVSTPSHWLASKVQQSMLNPLDLRVISNGIDLTIFHPDDQRMARSKLGLPLHSRLILYVGSASQNDSYKNFEMLGKAMAWIVNQWQEEVTLLCVGKPPEEPRSYQKEIQFVGYECDQSRLALYYQAADVYLHAAKAENYPYVILEAMACGLPVVATAVGGIPEQVQDGVTGFLVPPSDSIGLAERVIQLLTDDTLRASFSRQAAVVARLRFDLQHQVDAYLDWYMEILDKRVGSRT